MSDNGTARIVALQTIDAVAQIPHLLLEKLGKEHLGRAGRILNLRENCHNSANELYGLVKKA